jgi:hypothetical protein
MFSKEVLENLAIRSTKHASLPIQILNYSPSTPKKDPLARKCRSLVVDNEYNLISRSFYRFFNWGEFPEEHETFDWSDFRVYSKEDGSLVNFFYLDGWHMTTKSTFGEGLMPYADIAWREHIMDVLGVGNFNNLSKFLDPRVSYACELVGPYNKVIRDYQQPSLYLLATFSGENEIEVDEIPPVFSTPSEYKLSSIDDMKLWILENSKTDPSFEGFVAKDKNNQRFKLKSKTYYEMHSLKDNGAIYKDKNLLPHVLSNNREELLLYLPELADAYDKLKSRVDYAFIQACTPYNSLIGIESQKEFALRLKYSITSFGGVYFTARKRYGINFSIEDLRTCFEEDKNLVEKLNNTGVVK